MRNAQCARARGWNSCSGRPCPGSLDPLRRIANCCELRTKRGPPKQNLGPGEGCSRRRRTWGHCTRSHDARCAGDRRQNTSAGCHRPSLDRSSSPSSRFALGDARPEVVVPHGEIGGHADSFRSVNRPERRPSETCGSAACQKRAIQPHALVAPPTERERSRRCTRAAYAISQCSPLSLCRPRGPEVGVEYRHGDDEGGTWH